MMPFVRGFIAFSSAARSGAKVFSSKGTTTGVPPAALTNHEFVPVLAQSAQGDGQGRRRAAGHIYRVGGHARAETRIDVVRDGFAYCRVTLGGSVAVQDGVVWKSEQFFRRLFHAVGGGHVGIAKRKVVHFVRADLCGSLFAEFEKLADDGAVAAKLVHSLVEHIDLD